MCFFYLKFFLVEIWLTLATWSKSTISNHHHQIFKKKINFFSKISVQKIWWIHIKTNLAGSKFCISENNHFFLTHFTSFDFSCFFHFFIFQPNLDFDLRVSEWVFNPWDDFLRLSDAISDFLIDCCFPITPPPLLVFLRF